MTTIYYDEIVNLLNRAAKGKHKLKGRQKVKAVLKSIAEYRSKDFRVKIR